MQGLARSGAGKEDSTRSNARVGGKFAWDEQAAAHRPIFAQDARCWPGNPCRGLSAAHTGADNVSPSGSRVTEKRRFINRDICAS